uniref:Transposase n=1 Tax=Panagrolaimus davidi TaxID=227884 RepID=A0A914QL02_9BILA
MKNKPTKNYLNLFTGPVHFEYVPRGKTITGAVYREQLDRVQAAIIAKRGHERRVDFLQDNARPHTAVDTQRKIAALGWNLLPHPPYSPCLSPSDFQAFLSLSNWLRGKTFTNDDEVKQCVQEWIGSRDAGFWVHGFTKLPER